MANLNSMLARAAADHGERPAVRLDDLVLTYAQLRDSARRAASLLTSLGVTPGDRVGIMLPNVLAFPIAFYGALAAGATAVPMNPLLKKGEVAYQLGDSGAKVLFAWHEAVVEAAKGAAGTGHADPRGRSARYGRTARRTHPGTPDGGTARRRRRRDPVHLGNHRPAQGRRAHARGPDPQRRAHGRHHAERLPADVTMGCLPLFHVFGLTCGLNATIIAGGTLTLLPRFDPGKALEIIGRDKVTIFQGVPTMYAEMLHHRSHASADTSSLRTCISGGASMPLEIMRGFEQTFGCMILEAYGLSETSPVASFNHPDRERKPGSIGTPMEGVEMRVVNGEGASLPPGDVGEIAIRGHNVMKGYWGKPEATAEAIPDGWFRTGDLAKVDGDGYFFIVGREKDLIIRGGYNVYPREIEEAIHEHQAVAEVAVIGIPHAELGEEVGAAVQLRPGATATPAELRAFARERVAAYKYPRHVWLVPELPKGATGKILHREVRPPQDLP